MVKKGSALWTIFRFRKPSQESLLIIFPIESDRTVVLRRLNRIDRFQPRVGGVLDVTDSRESRKRKIEVELPNYCEVKDANQFAERKKEGE